MLGPLSSTESQVAVDATQIVIAHALCASASHLHIMLHERILSELQHNLITSAPTTKHLKMAAPAARKAAGTRRLQPAERAECAPARGCSCGDSAIG